MESQGNSVLALELLYLIEFLVIGYMKLNSGCFETGFSTDVSIFGRILH
jgi:hypothetical protein